MKFKFRIRSELSFIDKMIEYLREPERYQIKCGDLPKYLTQRKNFLNFGVTKQEQEIAEKIMEKGRRMTREMEEQVDRK